MIHFAQVLTHVLSTLHDFSFIASEHMSRSVPELASGEPAQDSKVLERRVASPDFGVTSASRFPWDKGQPSKDTTRAAQAASGDAN